MAQRSAGARRSNPDPPYSISGAPLPAGLAGERPPISQQVWRLWKNSFLSFHSTSGRWWPPERSIQRIK